MYIENMVDARAKSTLYNAPSHGSTLIDNIGNRKLEGFFLTFMYLRSPCHRGYLYWYERQA